MVLVNKNGKVVRPDGHANCSVLFKVWIWLICELLFEQNQVHFSRSVTQNCYSELLIMNCNNNYYSWEYLVNCNWWIVTQDLGRDDRERDAYLVAKVFRVGSLKESDNSKLSSISDYRRPYGCGGKSTYLYLTRHDVKLMKVI